MLAYDPIPDVYDEAFEGAGRPRSHYAELVDDLERTDLEALAGEVGSRLRGDGVTFGASEDGLLALDPVPRILPPEEWRAVAAGVSQRAKALDRFAADAYGDREVVAAGIVPERVIEGSPHFEPALRGFDAPEPRVAVVGFDLVRGADGRFRVLEDQVRMPSGIAYAVAAREIVGDLFGSGEERRPVDGAFAALGEALRDAAPESAEGDPTVALLSSGPAAAGWYEHVRIGDETGARVVTLADLERRGSEVLLRAGDARERVDVVYLRTDEDRLTDAGGRLTPIGELLLEPCRAGGVKCVNAAGSGVADDKLVHAYVDEMIRFYLDEEPVLESVASFDLGIESQRTLALSAPEELVFKPRGEMGGEGVVVWRDAGERAREGVLRAIGDTPEGMIAQRRVELSSHPTLRDGGLEPRRVDLRPYLIRAGGREWLLPGGLSRVALERGSLIVNSGRGGGVKDTWVMSWTS